MCIYSLLPVHLVNEYRLFASRQTADEIARLLYAERYGAAPTLLFDRGSVFMSELITKLCRLFAVMKIQTSSYHPQRNAAAERNIGSIFGMLCKFCSLDQRDWPRYVPGILCVYRSTPATESTTLSPYFIIFGRECRLPLDLALLPNKMGHKAQTHVEDICKSLEVG